MKTTSQSASSNFQNLNDTILKWETQKILQNLSDEESTSITGGMSYVRKDNGWLVYDREAGQCYQYNTTENACE